LQRHLSARINPGRVGRINSMLGMAHRSLGREGGIDEATLYYQNAVELAKKARNNELFTKGVIGLAECYVKMGRVD